LNITFREGTSNSNYNALWVTATKRIDLLVPLLAAFLD